MKRAVVTLAFVLGAAALFVAVGTAGDNPAGHKCDHQKKGGMDPAAHAAVLQEKLELNDATTKEVERIFRDTQPDQWSTQLEAVLTTDEMARLEELKAGHHGREGGHNCTKPCGSMKKAGCGPHGDGRFDPAVHAAKLQKELDLTDATARELEAALQKTEQARQEALDQIQKDHEDRLRLILSPEQFERYQELRSRHHGRGMGHPGCGHDKSEARDLQAQL